MGVGICLPFIFIYCTHQYALSTYLPPGVLHLLGGGKMRWYQSPGLNNCPNPPLLQRVTLELFSLVMFLRYCLSTRLGCIFRLLFPKQNCVHTSDNLDLF